VGGSTGKALIHDLDLLVTSPAGRTYYANGGNTIDTVNNVELIVVPGVYRSLVEGIHRPVPGWPRSMNTSLPSGATPSYFPTAEHVYKEILERVERNDLVHNVSYVSQRQR
jgi:hypothetical protein